MKILLYTYDIMKIGGIETSFFNLSQYLNDKGYEVGVRYNIIAPMQLKRYKDAGIDIQRQRPESCDILFIGSVWKRPKQVRARLTVQQVHADWTDKFWDGAKEAVTLLKDADKECDAFLPVSASAARFVKKHTTKPIIVMNNLAPEETKIKHNKSTKLVIAAFTRMSKEKGLENYQDLRKRIKSLGIDAAFRVYTNGEAPKGWKLYEPVPDIKKELPGIDFVASLADTESFGYTIAEANSCGVPCIIKHANSTLEFYSKESNIILDNIEDLQKKDLCRKISVNYTLRKHTEESIDTTMKQLEKMAASKCIIKSMRSFYDIEAKQKRLPGEVFTVSYKRAKELLSNKYKLVEVM